MTVYFTKNDDLIWKSWACLFQNDEDFFWSIRQHYFVLATTRNLHTFVRFYVIIRLNKFKSLAQKNLKIVFEYWKK